MAKLTTAGINRIETSEKRQEIADSLLPGLYLVVQPSGVKSWSVRYRANGVQRRMVLGRYPILGLSDARKKASQVQRGVMEGEDPGGQRKELRQLRERDTVKALLAVYERRHLSSLKSGRTVARELDRHIGARWGDRDIASITRRDVLDLLDEIVDSGRGTTANRLRGYLQTFFGFLLERDVIGASPMVGVKRPAKEVSRDRVLSDDEVRWFWRACEDVGFPWGPMGKVLLLTGQRLGEVAGMTDAEIDGDLWKLPAERVKNGRAHEVPLSKMAQLELGSMDRVASAAGLLFTTNGTSPVQGFHKGRKVIADGMERLAEAEIPHWTFHDLRRTAATGMARLGIAVRTTEAVLNHVSGTGGGIVGVYQRYDHGEEKRDALEAWGRFVNEIVNGRADKVVRLKVSS
ncbi:MAG: integrase arm-type DNA-binding domain-containing protein [Pseudomonadota bacterium]